MKKIYLLLFIAVFAFSSCEKDDICDASTATTPRLVIKFYDASNPAKLRNIINLKVIGLKEDNTELETGVVLNESGDTTTKYISNDTVAYIPLRTNAQISKFKFILNSTNTSTILVDNLQFNYTPNNVFVSRACGFKTLFNLDGTNPFLINTNTSSNVTQGNWIKDIEVVQPNINNENETHIKIYF